MARALKGWTQEYLAKISGLAPMTIRKAEDDYRTVKVSTIGQIERTFTDHNVEFLPGNGVRERSRLVVTYEGPEADEFLLNDIYDTAAAGRPEVLISGLREKSLEADPESYALSRAQVERLQKIGASEKILSEEGDSHYIAPRSWYRHLPSRYFSPVPLMVYGDKVALTTDRIPNTTIIIDEPLYAQSVRGLFMHAWDRAVLPPEEAQSDA